MYKKIIVPLDGSQLAECVLPHVENIAKACEMPEITFLYVIQPSEKYYDLTFQDREKAVDYMEQKIKDARDKGLNAQYEIIKGNPSDSITDYAMDLTGDPAGAIADYASKKEADLIVIATHGRSGMSRWAHGSTADKILRSSCVPVLMVRAPGCVPGIM